MLGCAKSTIWYEVRTNARKGRIYDARYAQHKSYVKRKYSKEVGMMIAGNQALRSFVEEQLFDDQSPEAISGRLRTIEKKIGYISAFAIRRYIESPYGRLIEHHRKKLHQRKRHRRGARSHITEKRCISKRPAYINARKGWGHFEGDFIASGKSGHGTLLALIDRRTRKRLLERIHPVSVRNVERGLKRMKKRHPQMRTITFDNDLLFLEHKRLETVLQVCIYFCHTHSPWEKPSVEKLNKDIRVYIPKGSDISKISRYRIKQLEEKLNRRFMRVLGFQTPDEAYEEEKQKWIRKNAVKA